MNTLKGIDVSSYQGKINWPQVKANGCEYAFVKAGQGITGLDSEFETNWDGAKSQNIIASPYHFFVPGDDPHLSAAAFLKTIGKLSEVDLPATLDFEVLDKSSVQTAVANAKIWLDIVEQATGKTPILYSYLSFFDELNLDESFTRYPLYQAEVNVAAPLRAAHPWKDISFWQNTWTERMPGITSNVDGDIFYGTKEQLIALCVG